MSYNKPPRDCFNRFNNDLMPVLLSYLPINDCFRLHCVSRRFKQNVFNSQTKLVLHNSYYYRDKNCRLLMGHRPCDPEDMNNETLNYVLTECKNINDLSIYTRLSITDETLNIIRDRCQRLKRLTIHINKHNNTTLECWQQLFDKGLQNLKSLSLYYCVDADKYLEIITTLVAIHKLQCLITNDENIYNKCFEQHMQHSLYNIESVDRYTIRDNTFTRFTNYFSHQIKSLTFNIEENVTNDTMQHLSHFHRLEHLCCNFVIQFNSDARDERYIRMFKLIGQRCVNLKVLEMHYFDVPFYDIFSDGFKSLEKLVVRRKYSHSEHIRLLENCTKLKHLEFINTKINENDVRFIDIYLPQLNSIDLSFSYSYADDCNISKLLPHFARLPNLHVLKIGYKNNLQLIKKFIDKSSSIRRIGLYGNLLAREVNKIQEYIRIKNRRIILTRV